MSENSNEIKLAVLIDAENVPYSNIKGILDEITKYGTPTIKRIYADWTKPNVSGWKNVMLTNAIIPIQQYSYTSGKNSSDSAMIIDAMDILYSEKVQGFCILSSDSDFTRLVTRLRESGMKVYGFGEKKTPQAFIVACDKFTYIEIIHSNLDGNSKVAAPEKSHEFEKINEEILNLIFSTVEDLADDYGWSFLGDIGNQLTKKRPDFDPRNFGFDKLTPLIKSLPQFEVEERKTNNKSVKHVFVRKRIA
ncbi:MAG: NYN domain-containing protein [Leptospiraceae bacterium]|nr:NYN domain-containing protein [Leptospiraceae bacterium]